MESIKILNKILKDLNLKIDHEGLSLLKEYLKESKRIGIIGLNNDQKLPIKNIDILSIHPDLFDEVKAYSNLDNLLPDLEDQYDLLVIVSNKKRLRKSRVPIVKLIPNNLYLEIQGPLNKDNLLEWLQELNINHSSIYGILTDNKDQILKNTNILPVNSLSHLEKNNFLIEEYKSESSHYFLFEKPVLTKQLTGNLNLIHLLNPEYLTEEQKQIILKSNVLFVENNLSSILLSFPEKETAFFQAENFERVLKKTLSLLSEGTETTLVYSTNLTRNIETYLKQNSYYDSIQLILLPAINWIDVLCYTFNLILDNFLEIDSTYFNENIDSLKDLLILNDLSLILKIESQDYKKISQNLYKIYPEEKEVRVFMKKKRLGYITSLEFLDISEESNYLILL